MNARSLHALRLSLCALSLSTLLFAAPAAHAETMYTLDTLSDVRIESDSLDANRYGDGYLSVYNSGSSNNQRSLLKFDLSSVAGNVTSATLTLTVRPDYAGNGMPAYVYRALKDWNAAQVTWNKADNTTLWTTPGGDYTGPTSSTAYAAAVPGAGNSTTSFDLTNLVQGWQNGSFTNYGLFLAAPVGSNATFFTHLDAAFQPVLTVRTDVSAVPETPSVVTMSLGLAFSCAGFLVRKRRK